MSAPIGWPSGSDAVTVSVSFWFSAIVAADGAVTTGMRSTFVTRTSVVSLPLIALTLPAEKITAARVPRLAAAQHRLLASAAAHTAVGGRLVYSVCSLEREEGEDQVAAFLKAYPDFTLDPIASGEGGSPEASLAPEGWLRILPHHMAGGLDGFFIARFRRAGGSG